MPTAMKVDPLESYREGVYDATRGVQIPLAATAIDVVVAGTLATVRTKRTFQNVESASIEATMTFPVPIDAVARGLRVEIDGRMLVGVAEAKAQARETYEAALDAGKTAILHEEALKGVHVLTVGHIPPGKEVSVEISWIKPLSLHGATPSLRIPTTVAEIYGRLPLLPADDILVHPTHVFDAELIVHVDAGMPHLRGRAIAGGAAVRVPLDRPIDLAFTGLRPRGLEGKGADGRRVSLELDGTVAGDNALALGVLFDRSGSTAQAIDGYGEGAAQDTWHAAMAGLRDAITATVRAEDRFEVWQFDSTVDHLGAAKGASVNRLLGRVGGPRGGTEAGLALGAATACEAITDVLFITDGRTGAIPVQAFAACGKRVSAVLCGANSLDAMIGHLCALTGGQIIVAASDNIAAAITAAVAGARAPIAARAPTDLQALPTRLSLLRGGVAIEAHWSGTPGATVEPNDVGAYAAALALPTMTDTAATQVAVAHGLCTHLTSLVVVDEASAAQEGVPNQRKVPLSRPMEAERGGTPMLRRRSAAEPMAGAAPAAAASPAPRGGGMDFMLASPRIAPKHSGVARLAAIASSIDWEGDANALSKGDLASLDRRTRAQIEEAARRPEIIALAAKAGMTPTRLVIALMAASVRDASRGAERIARTLAMSDAEIAAARAMLGL